MSNAFFVGAFLLVPAVAVYLLTETTSSEGFTLRGGSNSNNGPELVLFKATWCG